MSNSITTVTPIYSHSDTKPVLIPPSCLLIWWVLGHFSVSGLITTTITTTNSTVHDENKKCCKTKKITKSWKEHKPSGWRSFSFNSTDHSPALMLLTTGAIFVVCFLWSSGVWECESFRWMKTNFGKCFMYMSGNKVLFIR